MSSGGKFPVTSWSIDELSALVGLPTRTVREYRTMGMIDAPRREGRVGRYDQSHRRRLELIARLQARGYSLAAIRDLCAASATGQSLEDVLGGDTTAAIDDAPTVMTTNQLVSRVPVLADEKIRHRAVTVGLLHVGRDADKWVVRSPALLSLVGEAINHGASATAAFRLVAGLIKGARVQATAIADLVVNELLTEPTLASPSAAAVTVGRRARLLLSQSAATLIIDAVGTELNSRSGFPGGKGLSELVDALRIGAVQHRTTDSLSGAQAKTNSTTPATNRRAPRR